MRYPASPSTALQIVPLDEFVAAFHRPSGTTHLLVAPAPQILAALGEPLTLAALAERLAETYELSGDVDELTARMDELVAAGLVERA